MQQRSFFDPTSEWPQGLRYVEEFLTTHEEAALLEQVRSCALTSARYKEYTALRKTLHFGFGYDFDSNQLTCADPVPAWLFCLRERVANEAALPATDFAQALITEYAPGTPLGWHRDVPHYEVIVGVSLLGHCEMRLRPYQSTDRRLIIKLPLEPRSLYVMRGAARWEWQHAVIRTDELRYSITFRTMRPGSTIEQPDHAD